MSTFINKQTNGCYNIETTSFWNGKQKCIQFVIGDGEQWISISLNKKQALELCEKTRDVIIG